MKILNLYAGIGGNRKLWGKEHQIIAVENNVEIANIYHANFPKDEIIIKDAHQYLLDHIKGDFDFIWSSPPCPSHSEIRKCGTLKGQNEAMYADMTLYQEIILLKYFAHKKTKWVVENVKPYYAYLIKPQIQIDRHSIWSNFYIHKINFGDELPIELTTGIQTRFGFTIKDLKLKHRKNQILRNLVNPEIGLYLLEQSQKEIKPLFNFDY